MHVLAFVAGGIGLLALLVIVGLWASQEALIFPIRHNDAPVAAEDGWRVAEVEIPAAGRIAFLFAEPEGGDDLPVLLYLHGNAGSTRLTALNMSALAARGLPVVAAEYPGYAGNPGSPSEASLQATARATAAWARARWPGRRLAVLGESIGSAPAIHLATTGVADLLVLDSGFTSLVAAIGALAPWLPAARWLVRHPMDNLGAVRAATGPLPPTLVILSAGDQVIPAAMGEALAAAIPGSTVFRSAWHGHPVLYGDPRARDVLFLWLASCPGPAH